VTLLEPLSSSVVVAAADTGRSAGGDRAAGARAQALTAVLVSLTFVTGIVDAVTYLGLGHVFAANMTGNIVLLGFALVGADQVSASASLVSLGAFLVGATMGGRLARTLQPTQHRWIVASLALELGLLIAAMLSAAFRPFINEATIAGLLALAMGIRNASVRRLGIPDLTTTVLTMLLTVLAADSQTPGGGRDALVRRLAAMARCSVVRQSARCCCAVAVLSWPSRPRSVWSPSSQQAMS